MDSVLDCHPSESIFGSPHAYRRNQPPDLNIQIACPWDMWSLVQKVQWMVHTAACPPSQPATSLPLGQAERVSVCILAPPVDEPVLRLATEIAFYCTDRNHRSRHVAIVFATETLKPPYIATFRHVPQSPDVSAAFQPLVRHDPTSREPRLRSEPHSRRLVVVYHIWTHGIDAASPPTTVSSFRSSISLLVPFSFLFIISRLVMTRSRPYPTNLVTHTYYIHQENSNVLLPTFI